MPTFSNSTSLDLVLDAMQEAGLYLMCTTHVSLWPHSPKFFISLFHSFKLHSMYQNSTLVTVQSEFALVVHCSWTASDPLNATSIASLITLTWWRQWKRRCHIPPRYACFILRRLLFVPVHLSDVPWKIVFQYTVIWLAMMVMMVLILTADRLLRRTKRRGRVHCTQWANL